MGRQLTDGRRRRGLLLWVTFSSGLAMRGFWFAAHGGGATPNWLLRAETAAFSVSAMSGLAVLSKSTASDRAEMKALRTTTNASGAAAIVIHGVRLARARPR